MADNVRKTKKPTTPKPRDSECGLKLYYQPIVQPMFGKTIAYESLIRLIDKELHFLSPAVFMPIAEKSGLNAALGNWVVEESCRTLNKMAAKGIDIDYISLNVSTKHFQKKDFISDILKICEKTNVPRNKICMEISEFAMVNKGSLTLQKMEELHEHGFLVAIDDFGGEFAALSKLGKVPAHILKLDKRFVDNIVIDQKSRDVTESIIELALKLDLEVVAKGVEDSLQQKTLMQMGCQKMQGFLFGKPVKDRDILYPKKKKVAEEE